MLSWLGPASRQQWYPFSKGGWWWSAHPSSGPSEGRHGNPWLVKRALWVYSDAWHLQRGTLAQICWDCFFEGGGGIEPNKYCFERWNKVDLDFLPWVEILASLIEKQLIQGTYFWLGNQLPIHWVMSPGVHHLSSLLCTTGWKKCLTLYDKILFCPNNLIL